jgi:fumarylacetoacetate (FAA) hydrolase family protein
MSGYVMTSILADADPRALFVGRVWRPDVGGPSLVVVRDGRLFDITSRDTATMSELLERDDVLDYVSRVKGENLGSLDEITATGREGHRPPSKPWLLAPCDLQAIKACGVTFARSMLERVVEERAAGDPDAAQAVREQIESAVGNSIRNLVPGSAAASRVKELLQAQGLWSQYLEVGLGPDAEVFTKAQPMSAVGCGSRIGILEKSHWNNPEPEIVLALSSSSRLTGVTLGNDVNLRDLEGRSALLLGKAKDNNASCAIGPFIRLCDERFSIENIRDISLTVRIRGADGFELEGRSRLAEISRDPLELIKQTMGENHQYPDGVMLFLGTSFAPTHDRDVPGRGFTHKVGDEVSITAAGIGTLSNTVDHCPRCSKWHFGSGALMRNLARRGLLA